MAYDLTIYRVAALAGHPGQPAHPARRDTSEVVRAFSKQIKLLFTPDHYDSMYNDIVMHMGDLKLRVVEIPQSEETEATIPQIIRLREEPTDLGQEPLVALLPSRYIACTIGDLQWEVRLRASATACAHQNASRATKIWWSFEGVPSHEDPDRQIESDQVAVFLDKMRQIEPLALDRLHQAYRATLPETNQRETFDLQPDRIRVVLSDNDDGSMGALMEELIYGKMSLSDIRDSKSEQYAFIKQGYQEFERYVGNLTGITPAAFEQDIEVNRDVPGMSSLALRRKAPANLEVTGIARRYGRPRSFEALSPEIKREALRPAYLRSVSASRPLSAQIARAEGRRLDH